MKFRFACFHPPKSVVDDESQSIDDQSLQGFRVFSYKEIKTATGNFHSSNKIGQGGFGSVYKGHLEDGTIVGVKVLSVELESLKGEREFVSEITALSDVKHENLVTLRGCCIYGANRYLVYDYMENNSLSQAFLCGYESRRKFNWNRRRDVTLGIARGLAFLHDEIKPYIVHRDIKPANILLDENFTPKISDFGLSKLFTINSSHISTRVAGTLGYLAPEYAITGHLTRKSDVYSFGVLVLQMVSGSSVVEFDIERGETYLVNKAWRKYIDNDVLELVDPALNGDFQQEEAVQFLKVGLLCVQERAALRPSMSAAVKMLSSELSVRDNSITQPGVMPDLMHLKTRHEHSSVSAFSKNSSSLTTASYQSSVKYIDTFG